MSKKRRTHSAEFKAQVGMEALRGLKTVNEIAREYEVHPVQVSQWKKEIQERLPELFNKKPDHTAKELAKERDRLHKKVGVLTMDVDFLKKKCKELHIPVDE